MLFQWPDWPLYSEVHLYDDNNVHFFPVWGTILPSAIPTIVGNQEGNTLLHIGYVDLLSG